VSSNNKLPDSWSQSTVDNIYDVVGGGTPSTNNLKYWCGKIPWITSADIHSLKEIVPRKTITKEAIENSTTNLVRKNSLIVVTRVGLGKIGLADRDLCFSQDCQGLVDKTGLIDPLFALYYLSTAVQEFKHKNRGTTISGVTKKQLKELPLFIPPLNEQKRIVAKIEQLFSDLDAGVETLKAIKKQVRQYRQSVLKYAFEGKLTADWRKKNKPEPASILLEKIAKEKEQKTKGKKQKKSPPLDTSDLPELPEGWVWERIENIAVEQQYGTSDKASDNESGIPVIRMGNIQDGKLVYDKLKYFSLAYKEIEKFRLHDGDVLFNRTNSAELVGKTAVYKNTYPDSIFASYLIRLRLSESYLPDILSYYINSYSGRQYINSVASQQVGQANVNGTKLSMMSIPVMSFEEQVVLLSEIERHFSVADKIEEVVETALKQSNRLRQSILKQAFEGELVPQDPNDEPAELLLTRIKKEAKDNVE